MPSGTCDPASRGATFKQFNMEIRLPNNSGSVLIECRHGWDGVSTYATGCDGPVTFIHTRNTGNQTAWALLPDKKKSPLWVQLDPGTDVVTSAQGQLSNLGLTNASDVRSVRFSFVNPA